MSDHNHLCLSDLLDQDLSSFEYFQALPARMQNQLYRQDVRTFDQMQRFVAERQGWGDGHRR